MTEGNEHLQTPNDVPDPVVAPTSEWVPLYPNGLQTQPTPRRRRRRVVALLVAVVVVAAGSATGAYLFTHRHKSAKIAFPKQWDPRVLDYVNYVEKDRHLTFLHPIAVDFMSDEEFKAKVTSKESDLTDQDRKDLENTTALLRAVGLVSADFDPLKAANDLLGGSVVGLYDPTTKRIAIRGQDVSLLARPTVVHELTHALQDQHFDMAKHEKDLENDKSEAYDSYTAVLEGDAQRIEYDYRASLSASDQKELQKQEDAQSEQVQKDVADVPSILQSMLEFPYAAGQTLVALQKSRTGADSIDDLFVHPPVSSEQLIDPWRLFHGDAPKTVAKPALASGETELDDATFGDLGWYLVLAERIDTKVALRATDGWGGDHYVTFKRDGQSCVRVDYVGDTAADTVRLKAAIQAWIAAGPKGSATVADQGDGLTMTACATNAPIKSRDASEEAIALVAVRSRVASQIIDSGIAPARAQCFARKVVDQFSLEVLQAATVSAADKAKIQADMQSCA